MSITLIFPCLAAFRAGRVALGLLMLAMQLSIVLWPAAIRRAKGLFHEHRIQALLDQISVNYARQPHEKTRRFGEGDAGASIPEMVA